MNKDYSIDVEVKRSFKYETTYLVTKIKGLKPHLDFTGGIPYQNYKNVWDFTQDKDIPFSINWGLKGVTVKDREVIINENIPQFEGWYMLGIKEDGSFKAYPRSMTGEELVADGCVDATNIWSPLIENSQPFDFELLPHEDPNWNYIIPTTHPRQAVGRLADGTYVIVTNDSRMKRERGFTSPELQEIMMELGCVEAYNFDGGASTQTVIGKRLISRKHNDVRRVCTVMTFLEE